MDMTGNWAAIMIGNTNCAIHTAGSICVGQSSQIIFFGYEVIGVIKSFSNLFDCHIYFQTLWLMRHSYDLQKTTSIFAISEIFIWNVVQFCYLFAAVINFLVEFQFRARMFPNFAFIALRKSLRSLTSFIFISMLNWPHFTFKYVLLGFCISNRFFVWGSFARF